MTLLVDIGLAGLYRANEALEHALAIVRMNDVACRPALQLFERPAEVGEHGLVHHLDFAVWFHQDDASWKVVDDQSPITLACAYSVLCLNSPQNLPLQPVVGRCEFSG